jgi:hypothetical protein
VLDQAIRQYAEEKSCHAGTLERWLGWSQPDKQSLFAIANSLKMSENHLRDLMGWLEEIALRDGLAIAEILTSCSIRDIETDPRLGRADKLKRVKEHLRRLRFPRLAEIEDRIRQCVRELKVQPPLTLSVPPGLEGGRLRVEFSSSSVEELSEIARQLLAAAKQPSMSEIFALLKGSGAN